MRIDDAMLTHEVISAKVYLSEVVARKSNSDVIARAEIQVELLEELVLWRSNGKRWLEILNGKSSPSGQLSDNMFDGGKHAR